MTEIDTSPDTTRTLSHEYVLGYEVYAYCEESEFGGTFSSHWSTPKRQPIVRLFTEDQLRRALSSRTSNEAVVRVKPLEWGPYENPVFAGPDVAIARFDTFGPMKYQVQRDPYAHGYIAYLAPVFGALFWESKGHETLEEAKAAAQADYERRIRSALVSGSDAAVPGEDGWRVEQSHLDRALDFIEWMTANPLLDGDDIEMTLEDAQAHARIEIDSIRKSIAKHPANSDEAAASARFARLDGICSRILWTDYGVPALENEMTKAALRDLADYLFAAGIDKAVSAAPPLSQPVLRPDAISEQSSVGEE